MGLASLAAAFSWPMQVPGYNQNAHYALVRALADGRPYVDHTLHEIGELSSGDVARHGDHVYAVKAVGLALVSLPAFVVLDAAGLRTTGDPTRIEWALHLVGSVLPSLILVALLYLVADRIEPGAGALTALIAAIGTLVLPFATLFFAHALSTCLGFAAFAVLWRERMGVPRLRLVAAAGALAGLAFTAEYQLWLLAVILGFYAAVRGNWTRRLAGFTGGTLLGIAPALAFQWWAFGSPLHTAYQDYWREHDLSFWETLPTVAKLTELLLSSMGALTLMPVLAVGLTGCWFLYRRGLRAEALVIVAVSVVYAVHFSWLGGFGGLGPPRYLTTIVPFLAIPLATTLRRFPLTTIALGAVSAFQLVVMAATGPLAAYDGAWLERLADRQLIAALPSLVGITGWYASLPFFLFVAIAVVAAALVSRSLAVSVREVGLALAALASWSVIALHATSEFGRPPGDAYVAALAGSVGALVIAGALHTRLVTSRPRTVMEGRG